MRIYLLPSEYRGESILTLSGKDHNYLVNVLRIREGQVFTGRDRDGNVYELRLEQIRKGSCIITSTPSVTAEETTDAMPESRPERSLVLYQCLPKGRKADEIIKRATEIGVLRVVLVKSRNCIADISGKEESRLSRYDSMITEAIQQSGSLVPTKVEGVIDIKDVPAHFENLCRETGKQGLGLVLHQCRLKEDQSSLYDCVKGFNGTTAVLVGPEGGLTDEECTYLLEKNFKAVLLKTNILRCETASVYALGAVQTIVESTC